MLHLLWGQDKRLEWTKRSGHQPSAASQLHPSYVALRRLRRHSARLSRDPFRLCRCRLRSTDPERLSFCFLTFRRGPWQVASARRPALLSACHSFWFYLTGGTGIGPGGGAGSGGIGSGEGPGKGSGGGPGLPAALRLAASLIAASSCHKDARVFGERDESFVRFVG